MRFAWRALALLCLWLAGAAILFASSARAHDWYPWECCSGRDCAALAATSVRETPQGYVVTVAPGGHPMWPRARESPLVIAVRYGAAKPSPDGRFHLCIDARGALLCFYAAIGGF